MGYVKGVMNVITVKIGALEREVENADPTWINQQINGLRRDGHAVCVVVKIHEGPIQMTLATPTCAVSGGGRPPNTLEQKIFDLWRKHHLDQLDINGGFVVSFLNELKRVVV
jgi:hypothetical protein